MPTGISDQSVNLIIVLVLLTVLYGLWLRFKPAPRYKQFLEVIAHNDLEVTLIFAYLQGPGVAEAVEMLQPPNLHQIHAYIVGTQAQLESKRVSMAKRLHWYNSPSVNFGYLEKYPRWWGD